MLKGDCLARKGSEVSANLLPPRGGIHAVPSRPHWNTFALQCVQWSPKHEDSLPASLHTFQWAQHRSGKKFRSYIKNNELCYADSCAYANAGRIVKTGLAIGRKTVKQARLEIANRVKEARLNAGLNQWDVAKS